jgi:hypothetical protein
MILSLDASQIKRWMAMECPERNRLITNLKDKNLEYRKRMIACRVCGCHADTPEQCGLATYLADFEKAHADAAGHVEFHGC